MSRWTSVSADLSAVPGRRGAAGDLALVLMFAVAAALGISAPLVAQAPASARARLRPIASIAGKDLYKAYCEQCHGPEGKGDGPSAAALKTRPADLTQIAARNGGTYNRTSVESFIMGVRPGGRLDVDKNAGQIVVMKADGPDEMPPWEPRFRKMWPDEPVRVRVGNLAKYLETLQAK